MPAFEFKMRASIITTYNFILLTNFLLLPRFLAHDFSFSLHAFFLNYVLRLAYVQARDLAAKKLARLNGNSNQSEGRIRDRCGYALFLEALLAREASSQGKRG
jgi:ABC-type uncharacterized transport system fused permease/ATPase subunit